jgi:hypothetical protein
MAEVQAAAPRLKLGRWITEGVRAGLLMRPRIGGAQPAPWQLLALVVIGSALDLLLDRLGVPGDAAFDLRGLLLSWWNAGAIVLLAWWLLPRRDTAHAPQGVATWIALWITAIALPNSAVQLWGIAQAQDIVPEGGAWQAWLPTLLACVWLVAITLRLAWHFGARWRTSAALTAGVAGLFALSAWQVPDRPWRVDGPLARDEAQQGGLQLTQEIFEAQQASWQRAVGQLAPQRPGMTDVYGIVFAPYSLDDVFLHESAMVTKLLEERFDAQGRVIQLVNHASTAESLPWATPLNLQRAVAAVGDKMDREHDVLFVYMASHGASDFKLAASNPPLAVEPISPGELRQALDNAGIKHRVIVISACYAGGWVGPLADEDSLVMTAADATHTSYGCGAGEELTFFGRAVFDEQLRRTHSLEQAFSAAVPVIRQREQDAGKEDGFSNPQIQVGDRIRPLLRDLERRLDAQKGS